MTLASKGFDGDCTRNPVGFYKKRTAPQDEEGECSLATKGFEGTAGRQAGQPETYKQANIANGAIIVETFINLLFRVGPVRCDIHST